MCTEKTQTMAQDAARPLERAAKTYRQAKDRREYHEGRLRALRDLALDVQRHLNHAKRDEEAAEAELHEVAARG